MRRVIVLGVLCWAGSTSANVPAAFFACEDAAEGVDCHIPGPVYGNCVRDTLCRDNLDTHVDECLLCVDPCWGRDEEGGACLRRDGSMGVCAHQDQCTSQPEKSFRQCNRCVRVRPDPDLGLAPDSAAGDGGCASVAPAAYVPWLFVLLLGLNPTRRRRRGRTGSSGPGSRRDSGPPKCAPPRRGGRAG